MNQVATDKIIRVCMMHKMDLMEGGLSYEAATRIAICFTHLAFDRFYGCSNVENVIVSFHRDETEDNTYVDMDMIG
jgi:hypothetical protein